MLTIRSVMRIILIAVPVILALLLLGGLLSNRQPLGLRERLRKGRARWLPVIGITVLCVAAAFSYLRINESTTASMRIGFNYPEASKGLTPNGIHLNVDEILSDHVLTETVRRGGWDVTTDELRNTLSVTNLNPQSSVSAERQYLSTEYNISYQMSAQTRHINGDELLTVLTQSYQDYFNEQYGRKYNTISSDFAGMTELDYLDVYTFLRCRINNVADYMEMCANVQSSSFVSGNTNESFRSVAEKARIYRDNALERYRAYVLNYGISRDKGGYVSRLNYDNQMLNRRYMNNLVAYTVRLAAIDMYDRDITTAVLVPTRDEDGEYYQSRTKIGTDYFAAEANGYLEYVTDRQLEIETNNYVIGSFSNGTATAENTKRADEMIAELQSQITQISKLAEDTIRDYETRNSEHNLSFTPGGNGPNQIIGFNEMMLYAAVILVMAFAVACSGAVSPGRRRRER